MKKTIIILLSMAISIMAFGQHFSHVIDFEPNGTYAPGSMSPTNPVGGANSPTYWQYFTDAYGISFHLNTYGGGNPLMAQVGGTGGVFEGFTLNPTTLPATYSFCSSSTTAVREDMPLSNTDDVGCWFLTTRDANGQAQNLYIAFEDDEIGCREASGVMMDVDRQEAFMVEVYDSPGAGTPMYSLEVVSSGFSNNPAPQNGGDARIISAGNGDGQITWWNIPAQTAPIDHIIIRYYGIDNSVGVAFDNFHFCSDIIGDDNYCCEDEETEEMIRNGDFENGNDGSFFVNGFNYNGNVATHSVLPGQYTVIPAGLAGNIASTWAMSGDGDCDGGNVLILNGVTGGVNGAPYMDPEAIVFEVDGLNPEKEYVFCFEYRNLPQCSFEIFNDEFIMAFANGEILFESECPQDQNPCGWTRRFYTIEHPEPSMMLSVSMSHGDFGDGNDVAFDNFSLREKGEWDANDVLFFVNENDTAAAPGTFNVYVSPSSFANPLPLNTTVTYTIQEVECGNSSVNVGAPIVYNGWDPTHTWFTGYPSSIAPDFGTRGAFLNDHCYNITRTLSNCCKEESSVTRRVGNFTESSQSNMISFDNGETWEVYEGEEPMYKTIPTSDAGGSSIILLPNPGQGLFTIQSETSLIGGEVMVTDAAGNTVYTNTNVEYSYQVEVNVSEYTSGLYLVKITDSKGNTTVKKYIKE